MYLATRHLVNLHEKLVCIYRNSSTLRWRERATKCLNPTPMNISVPECQSSDMWLFSNKESASSLSAVGSLGLNFTNDPLPGFALDTSDSTRVPTIDGPYRLEWRIRQAHNKKKNNEEVSLLSLNLTSTLSSMDMESVQESVRQTVKWMKTLRHPNILNWIAGTDMTGPKVPNEYHIVTERVVPLRDYLRLKADTGNFHFISSWGIHQISRALAFLNDDAKISHNATRLDAVFVTSSGEWKLGALDFAGPVDSPPPAIRATASFVYMNQTGGGEYAYRLTV
ncbi:hypothetical protein EG68_11886 [Paragonimus skrjabini miyazakii]|uniref:Protein kinase domain-containing protein n=1 Tax=Paragonimus skrjabini miyazakii TaxID=59628 RepID=A0A8S9YKQ5_9TREM|nr:hypothetical protein EG68_11886 [Paragonimus skrjabini miyazakii]